MEELVFRFLLDSGYPRASIVDEFEFLPIAGAQDPANTSLDGTRPDAAPDYAIVDPETLERLAVFKAVGPLDPAGLKGAADTLARFAQRFGGQMVQGFLVRIDPRAQASEDSVRFYRVWPNRTPERVSTRAVPDLDTLRTRMQLVRLARLPAPEQDAPTFVDDDDFDIDIDGDGNGAPDDDAEPSGHRIPGRAGWPVWLPGGALAMLAVADRVVPGGVLDPEQAVLAVGAAALLCWATVLRRG